MTKTPNPHITATARRILDAFETGNVPQAIAPRRSIDVASSSQNSQPRYS